MASEGHRKSRPVRRQSHKTHSSPSQRERARGTRRWSTGVELHAQRTCGVALAQQPSGPVCAALVHESLESPIHGQARETFSAPRLGPLQAFLCATV